VRITRPHKDLDLTVPAADFPALKACLLGIGFRCERDRVCSFNFLRPGLKVDVFLWHPRERDQFLMIETLRGSLSARVPAELCQRVYRELNGVRLPVQPMWISRMFTSMISCKADIAFLEQHEPPDGYRFAAGTGTEHLPVEVLSVVPLAEEIA
jgi:hypothetical protein